MRRAAAARADRPTLNLGRGTAAAQYAKQAAHWLSLVEAFNQALKEIGDVEQWSQSIETDLQTIAAALEVVCKGSHEPAHAHAAAVVAATDDGVRGPARIRRRSRRRESVGWPCCAAMAGRAVQRKRRPHVQTAAAAGDAVLR